MDVSSGTREGAVALLGIDPSELLVLEYMQQLAGLLDSLVDRLGQGLDPAEATERAAGLLGLPTGAAVSLGRWREGACSAQEAWVAVQTATTIGPGTMAPGAILYGPQRDAERAWLERLIAALHGPLAQLRDGPLAKVAMRRLVWLGHQTGGGVGPIPT